MTDINLMKSMIRLLPRLRLRNSNLNSQLAVPFVEQSPWQTGKEKEKGLVTCPSGTTEQIKLRLISFIRLIPSSDAYAAPGAGVGDSARHVLHQTHETCCCKGGGQEYLVSVQVAALRA